MQGIAQEGYRTAGNHDEGLNARCNQEDDEGNRNGSDAVPTPFQGLIQRVLGVVRVRSDESPESAYETGAVVVVTMCVVVVIGIVIVLHVDSRSLVLYSEPVSSRRRSTARCEWIALAPLPPDGGITPSWDHA